MIFLSKAPPSFVPYSYRFKSFEPAGKKEAVLSDILILGDRMGQRLSFYIPALKKKRDWNIYNWSETGEGLHRTLNKVRHLSAFPPVVIYHGSVDEFYEKKFHPTLHYQKIRHNLITYQKNKNSFWAEFRRIAKVCGSRSYGLRDAMVWLEMAMHRLALDTLYAKGFTLISTPALVKEEALYGTGHFPMGRDQVYQIGEDGLFLSGTSEVQINYLHSGEILQESELPCSMLVERLASAGKPVVMDGM